jgi:hypothetical protein
MKAFCTTRPLPARASSLPGESLVSLLRRTSEAMGYESPRRLISLLQEQSPLPSRWNEIQEGDVFDYLRDLIRIQADELRALTVHPFAPSLVLSQDESSTCDAKTSLRYFTSSQPLCTECLREDATPYERLLWSFRPIPLCVEHGQLLIHRCPKCDRSLRSDRLDVQRCTCGALLCEADGTLTSAYAVELAERLRRMLLDRIKPHTGMPPPAFFRWMLRLAEGIDKTPQWLYDVAKRLGIDPAVHVEAIGSLAAAEILFEGQARLEDFLDVFQLVDKYKFTSTGVGRRFGTLLRHAARLEEIGYSAPAESLRRYLLDRYDGGHLSAKICLFQKPEHREVLHEKSWMTQTNAAKTLGLRPGAVAPLIDQGILIGKVYPAGCNGKSIGLVLKSSVETLKLELGQSVGVTAVASRLGIGPHAVRELIRRNLLPRSVKTAHGWRIPEEYVKNLEAVYLTASKASKEDDCLMLRRATRLFGPTGLTLGLLIELIVNGEISARTADPQKRLHGLVVSPQALTDLIPRIREDRSRSSGYPLHQLAKVLFPERPMKPGVLGKWIDMGLLKAQKIGRARIVSFEEAERFRSEFCLADEACRILQIKRCTLSRWEIQGRIRPVYGKQVTTGAGFSLYRRADLTHLSRRRKPRRES